MLDLTKSVNEAEKGGNSPLPEGDYEAVIDSAESKPTKDGKKRTLSIVWKIRADVKQQFSKRLVFENIGMDPDQINNPGCFNIKRQSSLIATQKGTDDYRTTFEGGQDEIIQYLIGKCALIHVYQEADEYNGETKIRNRIKFYAKSKVGRYRSDVDVNRTAPTTTNTATTPDSGNLPEVSDDDLPF